MIEKQELIKLPELTDDELTLIKKCYLEYQNRLSHFKDIHRYYYNDSDILKKFKPLEGRSNIKVKTNFIRKLVDEEAQYSFGNKFTYVSESNDKEITKYINLFFKNNKIDHDRNLGTELVKYNEVYEISYIDKHGEFKNKIINPLDGYAFLDQEDEIEYFLHFYNKEFDNNKYVDVYTNKGIYHLNITFTKNYKNDIDSIDVKNYSNPTPHYFGIVPVGIGIVGGVRYKLRKDGLIEGNTTIYDTIHDKQEAYALNLSDSVNEIHDFRNAILKVKGFNDNEYLTDNNGDKILDKNGQPIMKLPVLSNDNMIMLGDDTQDVEWLIKNVNDTFIKNTKDDLKDKIYALTNHIDSNEKMQSNLSGVALRSRLQSLEAKCRDNELAMENILQTRLRCLFIRLNQVYETKYDYRTINVKFTPNVPQDITSIAQIVSQVPHDVMSNRTKRSMFGNVNDVDLEQEQIDLENKSELDLADNLDKVDDVNE